MDLTLGRTAYEEDGIFGALFSEYGEKLAVTLEHAYQQINEDTISVSYAPKIPAGVYTCERYMSPKHGYEVFRLLDVPGSDYDEIHVGNYNEDSDGCILVGDAVINLPSGKEITSSKLVFRALMNLQEGINQFQLTIKDS